MKRCAGRTLILIVMLVAAARVMAASTDQARYEVEIDAPGDLRKLLQDNLSLIRWRRAGSDSGARGRIGADQLRRLFNQGKGEIERLVATEGYYTPTIDADLEETSPGRWLARYRVAPNAVTTVASVDLRFTGPIGEAPANQVPNVEALRAAWSLTVGDVFRQSQWESDKRRLLQELLIRSYPFAAVATSRAEVDVRSARAALSVTIASGPAVRFGPLEISGLKRYPPSTVRNLNPIAVGELYSQQQVFEFQRRLLDSGYFSRADVSIDARADPADLANPDPANPAGDLVKLGEAPEAREVTVPLRVAVVENTSKQLSVGLGVSTNSGPRASLAYNVLNFLGTAVQLRSSLTLDRLRQTLGTDIVFPTTATGSRYSVGTFVKREDVQGEVTRGAGLSARRAWGPQATERYSALDYLTEQKKVAGVQQTSTQTLAATYGVTFRRTDNLLSPTRGYLANAQVGAGVRVRTGAPFARIYAKALRYQPLSESNTLIVRAEFGAVAGKDTATLPSALLFRAGGEGSVRGYGYRSLGVRQAAAIVGGRYIATGTVELVHWLQPRFPDWGVAAFVDAGNAGNSFSALKPVFGYGTGVRWRSPVGVLDFDVARGAANGTTRLHFSLGVTF